ncbi:MAG TPA: class I SAM-dependent methyltransferase [Pseudonocardia sp.]|nr:class I SAM-dependent methyltransferase [Pseudonocardia sp.]
MAADRPEPPTAPEPSTSLEPPTVVGRLERADPAGLPADWSRWRDQVDLAGYDERWRRMAEAGENPHGEADLVCSYRPTSVLDAGCGTGRVAIELARRGVRVLGVDADPDMIAAASAKAPELAWLHADLTGLALAERFDVVVLAGNVVPYMAAEHRAEALAGCASALAAGGRLVAGFTLRPGWPTPAQYDGWCAAAGLVPEASYATWDGAPFEDGGDYLVAVHRAER